MKIYTRSGDEGETALFGGGRVSKNHIRVAAYGSVDELNATLGLAISSVADTQVTSILTDTQQDLFTLGASLATPGAEDGTAKPSLPPLPMGRVQQMEEWIDEATTEIPPLKNFILPGGSPGAATLHLARTVCRRAERAVVRLGQEEAIDPGILQYLNRLSDLLFVFARLENHRSGVEDVLWQKT